MRRLTLCALAAVFLAGCGGGVDGEWSIQMTNTCSGRMAIDGPDSALQGYWDCSNAQGLLSGTRVGNRVSLVLKAGILLHPLRVDAIQDGSSMRGSVQAENYPQHEFVASK